MEFNTSKLNPEQLTIFNAIRNAENGITMDKLLLQIGRPESYKRTVSEIITSLIMDYDIFIGSSSKKTAHKFGYFVIEDDLDEELAVRTLDSRVNGIKKRAEKIKKRKGFKSDYLKDM